MKWKKRSDYSIQCGEFTITRFVVEGKDQFWLYKGNDTIGVFDRAAKARAEAEKGVVNYESN